ncbi:hypothetical protein [Microcystis aeruginosa]|uniref:hypothetical protein n=1 Tax=Microcystis aeruginosa TaxID=1126 RepID=UPI0002D5ECEB|nr:hypothetical protein [Microcystis aeruginosa]
MSLSNCVRPPAIIGLITGLGFFGVFWWGLGARGAPLRVLGGLGFLGFFGGGWAHAVRPYGFWGVGFFGVFGGGWAHAVRPYGFWGGWVFWGFLVGVGRTRCTPTGFGGVFWGFQEKYVGVNCDRL